MQSFSSAQRSTVAMLLITLLAFAVRVIHLGGDSFWFDELLTFDSATQSLATIVAEPSVSHPPGFDVLEYGAVQIWGQSEFAVRLPSALAGALSVPLVYVIGVLIASRRIGLWSALFLALSPFHIRYSQEARGYAMQVALAAASTVCLLLALKRRQWRWWIGFGLTSVLGAYVLLGALLVLASQIAYVGVLIVVNLISRRWTWRETGRVVAGLAIAGAVIVIAYSPYILPAIKGVLVNIGPNAQQSDWFGVPITDWAAASYLAFGYGTALPAALMGGLALIGLAASAVRRNASAVVWLVAGSVLPLLAINLAGISRAPLPKYVLFILPVYLLAISIGVAEIIDWIVRRGEWRWLRYTPLIVGLALTGVSLPAIAAEHDRADEDWRAILSYVRQVGRDGDVFVPITLDLSDSFNQGGEGLTHYLPQYFSDYVLLVGEHLTDPRVADLARAAQSDGNLWIVVYQRNHPVEITDPEVQVIPFQGSFYVLHPPNTARPALEELIDLYPQIISQANQPAPQCYLWLDLARMNVQLGRYTAAQAAVDNFSQPCPGSIGMRQAVYGDLLKYYQRSGQLALANRMARELLTWNAKDAAALQVLTLYDLSAVYESFANGHQVPNTTTSTQADAKAGALIVDAQSSLAEPINVQRFEMPDTGDWGDAIVMQTPARLAYQLQLPTDPVMLVTRVAMAPASWDWGGDGARFIVHVEDEQGRSSVVFDQYVSNQPADRMWHSAQIPLQAFAGQRITLTLETDPGPNGDSTGDWAGWETPRIVSDWNSSTQP